MNATSIKNFLKRLLFYLHRFFTRFGVHILPVHYYSAVPDLLELENTRDQWSSKSDLPGLEINLDDQITNLKEICLPFQQEYRGNESYRFAMDYGFGAGYGYIEAQALHAVIRYYQPARVIEVGSGTSTWCMLNALKQNNRETGGDYSLTCIDPNPSDQLKALQGIDLIRGPVQNIGSDIIDKLGENDLLFIDSSHTIKPGGEVNYLILEILPRLNPGVIVHFHDIYLPYDYQRDVLRTFFHWMETSLLRAFLIHNDRAEILFCQSHMHYECQETLYTVFPEYNPEPETRGMRGGKYKPFDYRMDEHFPSSIYIRIH